MPQEFVVESFLSTKQLNNQSVSLVIPRLTRDKIHKSMYYKVNLTNNSMRGNTILQLINIIIRDLGTLKGSNDQLNIAGGVEFKCILMKLIEIRPTWDQLLILLDGNQVFDNKYIVCLVLTYIRIQYHYLNSQNELYSKCQELFKSYLSDFRKVKSVSLNVNCWSLSETIGVEIVHIDELVETLLSEKEVWGLPLAICAWCTFDESDSSSDSDDIDSE